MGNKTKQNKTRPTSRVGREMWLGKYERNYV